MTGLGGEGRREDVERTSTNVAVDDTNRLIGQPGRAN